MTTATKGKDSQAGLAGDKYFNLIEHAADGIAIIQDGVFKLVNTALSRISGYDKEELLGMPFTQLLTPQSQKLTVERYHARLAGKKVRPVYNIKAITRDGKILDIEINAALTEYEGRVADEVIIRDITKRKQAQEELREAEEEKSALLEEAPIAILNVDLKGKITYVNNRFESETGYSREEIIGKNSFKLDWFSEGTLRHFMQRMAARLGGKPHSYWETQFKRKDGTWIWVTTEGKAIKKLGVPVGFQILASNITERKKAEEALRESEDKYKTLAEDAPIGIYFNDFRGAFLYGNKRAEEITGYNRQELLDKSFLKLKLLDPKDIIKAAQLLALNKLGKATGPDRFTLNRKDGTKRIVEIRTRITTVGGEKVVLGMVEDITERKRAEDILKESEDKYRTIFENVSDVIIRLDKYGIITDMNGRAEEFFGYKPEEMIGRNFTKLGFLKLKDVPKMVKLFGESIRGKRIPSTIEVEAKSKDGSNILLEVNTTLFKKEGKIEGTVAIVRDVTERKKAEQALADEATRRRILVDQSRDGIVVLDQNGKVYESNQQFAEMLGYTPEEVRELYVWDWEVLASHEQILEMLKNVDEAGDHFETRHRRQDGTAYDVEISTNGAVVAGQKLIFCVCRDITERKQAEQALQTEKNKLQSVINAMEYGLTIQDKDYNILYQTEPVRRIHGDHPGEKCYRVYEGRDKICDGCPVEKAFKDGQSHTSERKTIAPSGEVTFWENTASPIKDANEKVVSCLEITRDITERKQIEEALRQSEKKYKNLAEATSDMIWEINEKGTFTFVSPRIKDILGYEAKEVAGKMRTLDLIAKAEAKEWLKRFKKINAKKEPFFGFEITHLHKNGTPVLFETSGIPTFDNAGNFKGYVGVNKDITERKKMLEALQTEKNKLQSVINAMEDDLSIQDKDYNIIYQNEPSRRSSGGDRTGEKCYRAYEGRDKVCDGCPIGKAFKDGKSHTSERKTIAPSGEVTFFETTANPIRDAGGNIVSCLEIGRNITERKRMEEQLREKNEQLDAQNEELRTINEELQATEEELQNSQERLERMFESVTDSISVINLDGIITKVNRRTVEIHGFASEDEILGRNAFDLVAPRDHERIAAGMHRALTENLIIGGEYTLLKADGSEFPGELSTSALKDGRGNVMGHITIARDVTKRKQMEDLFKTVTNSSPVGIYIFQSGKFQMANPHFQKLTGYTAEELTSMNPLELVIPEDRDMVRKKAVKMLKGERSSPYQFRVINKSGEARWVMETVTSIEYRGKRATLGNYLDITERKQAEEREKQLEQELNLAGRLASIGQLAAGVAHEINNPLTGVIGFSHLMMNRDIPNDMKQDLQVINSEAQRVAKIVENLLVFAHQRKTGREYVAINDIITKVLELRTYEMRVNNIEVETRLDPNLPLTMADTGQLQQVFLNIVLNAEYSMTKAHHKGNLLVKTGQINGKIRASLTDNGAGISRENLDKIFNPFFTTKEVGKGTGLGLSICHGIITQHDGRIYARSEPGKGATFVIELPIAAEPTQADKASKTKKEPEKPRGAKILVVDDEEAILTFLHRLLTDMGHSVETINSADAALERLKTERYSLILLDIKLPGMSGIELYRHIEEIAPALTRRVMFITGDIMEGTTRDFLEKAGVPHITKPLDIEVLKKMINSALNQTQVAAKASE